PRVSVSLPQFAQFSQDRQWIAVPRGNRYATLIYTSRANTGAELVLDSHGLPAKGTATSGTIPPYMGLTPGAVEAASDAPLAGALADFSARPADPKQPPLPSRFSQNAELVYGEPNLTPYWSYLVPKAAVAVTEAAPFKITIVEPKVPLVHNG